MKSGGATNTGAAIRSLLTWILVLLVLANIVVWAAWPLRDKLVAQGVLAPPPVERVDLDPQPLPRIVEHAETVPDAEQVQEPPAIGHLETESDGFEATDPPETGFPPASRASPEVADAAPTVEQPVAPALLDCVVVGPVESRRALEAVATRLRSTGALVDSPEGPGDAALDYHVYVEPSASWDAARAVEEELEGQSIEDVDIILRGTYENAVAVGVYRNRNLAEARRDRIAALGYNVKVRERHRLRAREVSTDALGGLNYDPCADDEDG